MESKTIKNSKFMTPTDDHDGEEGWIYSYADLITLLLGFFIIMQTFSVLDEGKFEGISKSIAESIEKTSASEKAAKPNTLARQANAFRVLMSISGLGLSAEEAVQKIEAASAAAPGSGDDMLAAEGIDMSKVSTLTEGDQAKTSTLTIPSEILFTTGTFKLSADGLQAVISISERIKVTPGLLSIEIKGHTDSSLPGRDSMLRSNFGLSSARAGIVAEVLLSAGIPASLITVRGMGSLEPVIHDLDASGKFDPNHAAKNRRVEIILRRIKDAAPGSQ